MRSTDSHRDAAVASLAVLSDVLEGRSLDRALPARLVGLPSDRHALVRSIATDLVRWQPRHAALVDRLLREPIKPRDRDLHRLLQFGILQLERRRIPPHAAVDSTVSLVDALGKRWARGLVNAVLRNHGRRRAELEAALPAAAKQGWPEWWHRRFEADWPGAASDLAERLNRRAPMTLRINRRQATAAEWSARYLTASNAGGVSPLAIDGAPDARVLPAPAAVSSLPGFTEGAISVQDAAAQLAASLLKARPGDRLLDACAAPGGKTAHALERGPWHEVVALDIDGERLARVRENVERLGLERRVRLVQADAASPDDWWDGRPFDAILLDAPCSGSGVVRRHPDIKLLRRPDDIPRLAALQGAMLDALWPLLRPGGRLLYATCSVLRDENDRVIEAFLARRRATDDVEPLVPFPHALGRRLRAAAPVSIDGTFGWQLWPDALAPVAPPGGHDGDSRDRESGSLGSDGFFYALLGKRS